MVHEAVSSRADGPQTDEEWAQLEERREAEGGMRMLVVAFLWSALVACLGIVWIANRV